MRDRGGGAGPADTHRPAYERTPRHGPRAAHRCDGGRRRPAQRRAGGRHALRMLRSLCHGFATLEAAHAFQWSTDVDASFDWLVAFADRGLRAM
ncbi:TetR-like C-terminal domain-containing protein [Streptomyces tendae]